ncbi:hypothetical protein ABW20_dc0104204 [Dactylellina cionopaga]|nr:hypothetical protein ABW20_dc0104204 [Dactylellina cionopaga]
METYREVDLDEDPVVFLSCGHMYTISSLDGYLELKKHYAEDEEVGRRRILLSGESLKGCPDCRRPLRDIDRYNRVFKSVLLDQLTRRFVARSTAEYAGLMQKLHSMESNVDKDREELIKDITKSGPEAHQLILSKYRRKWDHLRNLIRKFNTSVSKTEQPLAKVNDLYASALAQRGESEGQRFEFDETKIQTGLAYRAKCLEIKAKWIILWDRYKLSMNDAIQPGSKQSLRDSITVELKLALEDAVILRKNCQAAHLPFNLVEARVYHAFFCILNIKNQEAKGAKIDIVLETAVRKKETNSLEECERLCQKYPGTLGRLKTLVEEAKRMVENGVFYSQVTSEEENMVIAAMAAEFQGSGHWYYCVNGHPENAVCQWKKPGVRNALSQ